MYFALRTSERLIAIFFIFCLVSTSRCAVLHIVGRLTHVPVISSNSCWTSFKWIPGLFRKRTEELSVLRLTSLGHVCPVETSHHLYALFEIQNACASSASLAVHHLTMHAWVIFYTILFNYAGVICYSAVIIPQPTWKGLQRGSKFSCLICVHWKCVYDKKKMPHSNRWQSCRGVCITQEVGEHCAVYFLSLYLSKLPQEAFAEDLLSVYSFKNTPSDSDKP